MDIRSFFAPKGGTKPAARVEEKKKKMAISDSDSDSEVQKPKKKETKPEKKKKNVISDSESDEEPAKKAAKPTEVKPKKKEPKAEPAKPKLKEINATDFFATSNAKSTALTPSKKRKEDEREAAATMQERTTEVKAKKQRTDSPPSLASKLAGKVAESRAGTQVKASPSPPTKAPPAIVSSPSPSSRLETAGGLDDSLAEIPGTPQEQHEERKSMKQAAYRKFLSRGGAKNPGSKVVPEGSPDCLAGLVFVLSGVFESLEREEMAELVKRLGGKVTTSISKNTTYLVAGEEAGASKLEKAEKLGTTKIDEDGLLELIREKTVKEKENKTPKNSPDKKEEVSKEVAKKEKASEEKKYSIPKIEKSKSTEIKKSDSIKVELKVKEEGPAVEAKFVSKHISPEKAREVKVKEEVVAGEQELWVDKYRPTASKAIIGQQGDRSNMNKLKIWLRDWNSNHLQAAGKKGSKPPPWGAANDNGAWAKCALLSGPPGVGKTTTAYLVSSELGFDVVEMNASDTRSKKMLTGSVADTLNTTSVANMMGKGNQNEKVTSKRVLLMDEVDGMAGNEDRGGVAELIALLKTSKVPVIAMCNDRQHQKIRSLANHCFDLRFQRPRVEQIKAAMMSVCFKEKIPIKPEALTELINGCGQDVRQVLHHLSMVKASGMETKMDAAQAKHEADVAKKTSVKIGPWDVCKSVFSEAEHKTMTLYDKSDLYFHDYNLAGLFVQENYLASKPTAAGGDKRKVMELVSQAADSIAEGDLVERGIRSGMNWSLLPTAAVFCSVLPGEYMRGFLTGQVMFPSWLGKNSRRSKMDRILAELQGHTRLAAGVSKGAMALDYSQRLRDLVISPLVKEGGEGVEQAVANMNTYNLLREDLEGLVEVAQWPNKPDPWQAVDSKVKAAFTRRYNKESAALPFAVQTTVTKKAKTSKGEEDWGEENDEEAEEEEENSDVEADAMIKMKKKPTAAAKKAEAGTSKGKAAPKTKPAAKGKK